MSALVKARLTVAQGSRILAAQDVLDAFGHVSCRHPTRPDRFLIPRNLAPALVTENDVVDLDLDGNLADPSQTASLFLERFIHGEIYRQRPDVRAVVHSHALPVMPFTVVPGARLQPICHMCGFLAGTPAPFDVATHDGPATDLLIRTNELGRHLADHLGCANVVLMRSHGYTTVGTSVAQAVYHAIYTKKNCEIELAARTLGEPAFLSSSEAEACERTISTQISRSWNLWLHESGITAAAAGEAFTTPR